MKKKKETDDKNIERFTSADVVVIKKGKTKKGIGKK